MVQCIMTDTNLSNYKKNKWPHLVLKGNFEFLKRLAVFLSCLLKSDVKLFRVLVIYNMTTAVTPTVTYTVTTLTCNNEILSKRMSMKRLLSVRKRHESIYLISGNKLRRHKRDKIFVK